MAVRNRQGRKVPRYLTAPSGEKIPRGGEKADSTNNEVISWHFGLIDNDGPWPCRVIDGESLWTRIHTRMSDFETMEWGEILRDKHSHHFVKTSRLIPLAQRRLEELQQDDISHLFSLRISGEERVWGIRDRHILKVLWWDPNHEVCPSNLKRT